jgi:uncharacterized membrane protein
MARPVQDAVNERLRGWRRDRLAGVSAPGAVIAIVAYIGANTPSLLPRPWYFQGLIAAVCALLGYVVGVGVGSIYHLFVRRSLLTVHLHPAGRRILVGLWVIGILGGLTGFPLTTLSWQRRTAQYVGYPAPGAAWLLASTVMAIVAFAALVSVWRVVAGLLDWVTARIERRIVREWIARTIATLVTLALALLIMDDVVMRGFVAVAQAAADRVNATTPTGYSPPSTPLRTGGPGSHEPWTSLGQDGEIFVSSGPTADDIRQATGSTATTPIRVFAGDNDGRTMQQTRDAVLAEMDRTGAFKRSAILVVTSTSTGFINQWSASSFEYLTGGDCAIASMQYSTLPSALAFMFERESPPQAASLLLASVRARIDAFPAASRPKLYVSGESLGAFGGNGAFPTPEDMVAKVDGALWTGTPSFTPNRLALTERRTLGSTVIDPVIDAGAHFRFAGNAGQLTADEFGRPLGTWTAPRIAYLQHDSDPVAWWSPELLVQSPSWLGETRTPDNPMSQMSWLPFVTFFQVTADLTMSNNVATGHGHQYGAEETVPAWAAILGKDPRGDYGTVIAQIQSQLG